MNSQKTISDFIQVLKRKLIRLFSNILHIENDDMKKPTSKKRKKNMREVGLASTIILVKVGVRYDYAMYMIHLEFNQSDRAQKEKKTKIKMGNGHEIRERNEIKVNYLSALLAARPRRIANRNPISCSHSDGAAIRNILTFVFVSRSSVALRTQDWRRQSWQMTTGRCSKRHSCVWYERP